MTTAYQMPRDEGWGSCSPELSEGRGTETHMVEDGQPGVPLAPAAHAHTELNNRPLSLPLPILH